MNSSRSDQAKAIIQDLLLFWQLTLVLSVPTGWINEALIDTLSEIFKFGINPHFLRYHDTFKRDNGLKYKEVPVLKLCISARMWINSFSWRFFNTKMWCRGVNYCDKLYATIDQRYYRKGQVVGRTQTNIVKLLLIENYHLI